MRELKIPMIYDENGNQVGYGGSPQWFKTDYAQKYGSVAVVLADMYAYYTDRDKEYSYDEFMTLMFHMFDAVEPDNKGFPFMYKFAWIFEDIMEEYLMETDKVVVPKYFKKTRNYKQTLMSVKKCIDAGNLMAIVILNVGEVGSDRCLWLCITGYELRDDGGYNIIYSKQGERFVQDAETFLKPVTTNLFHLVYFQVEKKNSTEE